MTKWSVILLLVLTVKIPDWCVEGTPGSYQGANACATFAVAEAIDNLAGSRA